MGVGEKIKYLRESSGLTQTELGERLGVKKNAVSKWECGRVEDIPTSKLKAMANLFGVTASYFIEDDIPVGGTDKRLIRKQDLMFALARGQEDVITDAMFEEIQNFADYVIQREAAKKEK